MSWEPGYTTTEDLANFVRIGDTLDDAVLSLAISTASRVIDRACNRQFGKLDSPAARYCTARWDAKRCRWVAPIHDLMTVSGLVVGFDTLLDESFSTAVTDYALGPRDAAADGRPWTEITFPSSTSVSGEFEALRVTAAWGWTSVPAAIEQACLLQASRLIFRRDSPLGVAGSPEMNSEVRLLSRLDPDVAVAVKPYRRMWGAV